MDSRASPGRRPVYFPTKKKSTLRPVPRASSRSEPCDNQDRGIGQVSPLNRCCPVKGRLISEKWKEAWKRNGKMKGSERERREEGSKRERERERERKQKGEKSESFVGIRSTRHGGLIKGLFQSLTESSREEEMIKTRSTLLRVLRLPRAV